MARQRHAPSSACPTAGSWLLLAERAAGCSSRPKTSTIGRRVPLRRTIATSISRSKPVDLDLQLPASTSWRGRAQADRSGSTRKPVARRSLRAARSSSSGETPLGTETSDPARPQHRQRALAVGAGEVDHRVEVGDQVLEALARGSRSPGRRRARAATRPARRRRCRSRWRRAPWRSAPRGGRRRRRRRGPGRRRRPASAIVSTTICQAVSPASGSAPASSWERACGLAAKWRDGAVTYSA